MKSVRSNNLSLKYIRFTRPEVICNYEPAFEEINFVVYRHRKPLKNFRNFKHTIKIKVLKFLLVKKSKFCLPLKSEDLYSTYSSDDSCRDTNLRFTMVPFRSISDQV